MGDTVRDKIALLEQSWRLYGQLPEVCQRDAVDIVRALLALMQEADKALRKAERQRANKWLMTRTRLLQIGASLRQAREALSLDQPMRRKGGVE